MDEWRDACHLLLALCLSTSFSHCMFGDLLTIGLPKILFSFSVKFYIINSWGVPLDHSLTLVWNNEMAHGKTLYRVGLRKPTGYGPHVALFSSEGDWGEVRHDWSLSTL